MRWLIDASLKFRLLVIAVAIGLMGMGITELRDQSVDVLPEFTPAYVEIQTEALGLSANEVEQLITVPLEADLLNGIDGVDTIRSSSVPGMSSIVMVFEHGVDPYRGRALVQERLTQAVALPNVSKPPLMLQPKSSDSRVLMIGLSDGAKPLSAIEKGLLARWTIRPRLLGVKGVANVAIWGQREQQLQVQVDPPRLREQHVTLSQIIKTAGNAQIVSPLTFLEASTPGTGGFIETPTQRLQVRHIFDRLSTPAALSSVPVEDTNGRLSLGDVSRIVEDHQPLIGDAVVHGGAGLMLVVEKLPGANTIEVTRGVEEALDDLRPGLAGMRTDTDAFRPATYVHDATHNLTVTIAIGVALLMLVLAALLAGWRPVVVAVVAIALSFVAGAFALDLAGATMNALSFAGLAVAVGVVVGDAVAGAAAGARGRPDEAAPGARGRPDEAAPTRLQTVRDATASIRGPLTLGALVAVLAVVPLVAMEGRPGAFFEPLALAFVAAVLASTLVAATVTPALSLVLAPRAPSPAGEPALARRLGGAYAGALARIIVRPRAVLIAAGVALLAALALLPLLGASVIPTFKDRNLIVALDAAPGTSQPAMTRIVRAASVKLEAIEGVRDVGAHIGRAVTGDQIVDVNSSELWVDIDDDADYDKTVASVNAVVDGLPGLRHDVVTYTQQKLRDVGTLANGEQAGADGTLSMLTGTHAALDVRVFGEDLSALQRTAERVRQLVAGVDGVVAPHVNLTEGKPEPTLEITVDVDAARRHGIKPGDVRRAEAILLQGIGVGSIFGKQKVFDVVVQGVPSLRRSVANVRNLLVDGQDGTSVRLGDVADVSVKPAPSVIHRDAVSRRLDVLAGIASRSTGDVVGDVRERLKHATFFPAEYHAEVLTDSTAKEIGGAAIVGSAIAALIAMFLLLQVALRSWRVAALVFATLPVALAGGVLASLLDGSELSLGALIGLVAVLAFAVRGALVLVTGLQQLGPRADAPASAELVAQGAREQLPGLLTATLATMAILLPFALRGDIGGLEVVHPMAIVMLGGLAASALVTLFLVPVLYLRFATPPEPLDDLLRRSPAQAA